MPNLFPKLMTMLITKYKSSCKYYRELYSDVTCTQRLYKQLVKPIRYWNTSWKTRCVFVVWFDGRCFDRRLALLSDLHVYSHWPAKPVFDSYSPRPPPPPFIGPVTIINKSSNMSLRKPCQRKHHNHVSDFMRGSNNLMDLFGGKNRFGFCNLSSNFYYYLEYSD